MTSELRIGDTVSTVYGDQGVIRRRFDDFSAVSAGFLSMSPTDWLAAQDRQFTPDELAEPWYAIAVGYNGQMGQVCMPASLISPDPTPPAPEATDG